MPVVGQSSTAPQPVIDVTPNGLVLNWNAPTPAWQSDGDGELNVTLPGWKELRQPGQPRIPMASILLALPSNEDPAVEILSIEEEQLDLPGTVKRFGYPDGVLWSPGGEALGGSFSLGGHGQGEPLQPVTLERLGRMRGAELARLTFYPAIPEDKSLRVIHSIRVAVQFSVSAAIPPAAANQAGLYQELLASLVVNPQHLVFSPSAAGPLQNMAAGRPPWPASTPAVAIHANSPGITAVTYDSLAVSGYPVESVDPTRLHIAQAGQEIAWEWVGDSDGQFEPGERLLFYAQPHFSRWSTSDVYFLWEEGEVGIQMNTRPASPAGLPAGSARAEAVVEQNRLYTPDCYCAPVPAGRDGDRWVWDRLQRPETQPSTYSFSLPSVDSTQPATIDLWMIGFTSLSAAPDHRVNLSVNGIAAGSLEWDGKTAAAGHFDLPTGTLLSSSNQLNLALPGIPGVGVEGAWLDAFSVRYVLGSGALGEWVSFTGEQDAHAYSLKLSSSEGIRAYQVDDPTNPVRLSQLELQPEGILKLGDGDDQGPHHYWVTSEAGIQVPEQVRLVTGLLSGEQPGADYLVIAPAAFHAAIQPLLDARTAAGLQVVVEDPQAIYDHFGDGRLDPQAIYRFISDAYQSWDPIPQFLLLVGDGSSDPKDYTGHHDPTWIPPYLAEVDPWAGETAADNRYVTVDGEDAIPDLLVGRLPVNSPEEASQVVTKLLAYGSGQGTAAWNRTGLFVADDPDEGGNFPNSAESIATRYFPPPWVAERRYYSAGDDPALPDLISSWNAGSALTLYFGHASVQQWASENFLHVNELPSLAPSDRLPVVLEMTCFTGSFHIPGLATLDESLLRQPQAGAVAVWGSTGLGISTGHEDLAEGFMEHVTGSEAASLGEAALAGKLNLLAQNPGFADLVDTFTLFGDPAGQIRLAQDLRPLFLPLVQR